MALTVHDPNDSYYVKVFAFVSAYLQPGVDAWVRTLFIDPIVQASEATYFDLGWFLCEDTIRRYPTRGRGIPSLLRTKPVKVGYDPKRDWAEYGSILSSISSAMSLLRDGHLRPFDYEREHLVRHDNIFGSVGFRLIDDLYPPDSQNYSFNAGFPGWGSWFIEIPTGFYPEDPYWFTRLTWVPSAEGYSFSLVESDPSSPYTPHASLQSVIQRIASYGPLGHQFVDGDGGTSTMSSEILDIEFGRWNFRIDYRLFYTYDHPSLPVSPEIEVLASFRGQFDFEPDPQAYISLEEIPVASLDQEFGTWTVSRSYTTESVNNPSAFSWFPLHNVGDTFTATWVNHDGHPSFLYGSRVALGRRAFGARDVPNLIRAGGPLKAFSHEVDRYMHDIRGAAFYSTADALNDATAYVNNDVLQTLSKLNDLSSLMPNVSLALAAISGLRYKNLIGLSIVAVLDFITQTKLQQSFQYRPQVEFLLNVLPDMRSTLETILRRTDTPSVIGRGVFRFEFPSGEFGRERSSLEARSRVVFDRDVSAILTSVLDVRSLGVLPSPSNIWDLIPFSFVVSWFTGVGQRIRDIENIGYLIASGARCFTYTYRVTSPLTQRELDSYGLAVSNLEGSDWPTLCVFRRDVSAYISPPVDGRYDFRQGRGIPDLGAFGSLIWQVLLPQLS
jgi:hypothetical protein